MKLKGKSIFKILAFVLAFVLVFILGSLFTILYLMVSSLETTYNPDLSEISKITKLNFSKNVKIIGSEYVSSLDDSLYIALEIPEDEIEDLFPGEKLHPSTTIRYLENENTRERKWFNPNSIKDFKSFNYTNNTNTGMYVLYENSDAAVRKVYILWFSS